MLKHLRIYKEYDLGISYLKQVREENNIIAIQLKRRKTNLNLWSKVFKFNNFAIFYS